MTDIRFNNHGLQQPESDHGYTCAMTLADPSLIRGILRLQIVFPDFH